MTTVTVSPSRSSTRSVEVRPKTPLAKVALKFAIVALTRRWRWLAIAAVVGVVLGQLLAGMLGKQSWEANGTLLYTPLPIPEAQKGLYVQPDLPTLVSLMKSPHVLDGLLKEFELPIPASLLDKLFKVTAPRSTSTVTVNFVWGEADLGAKLTNRMMERFIDSVQENRAVKLAQYLEDYESRSKEGTEKHDRAVQAYYDFLRNAKLSDAKVESDMILREIGTLRDARTVVSRNEKSVTAQRDRLNQELEDVKKRADEELESDRAFEAAQETIGDNRRRQDRLKELIEEDKRRQEWLAELTVKRKEYERLSQLRVHGASPQTEVDAAAKEIEILNGKLNDTEKVKQWKDEVAKIDEIVVPKGKSRSPGSPIVQQSLFRRLEFDLQLIGMQKDLFEIDRGLMNAQRRQEEIRSLTVQSEGLQKQMEAFDLERTRLAEQVALFQRLRNQKANEFAIVSPAVPSVYPMSTSRKIWLIVGFALPMGAAFAGVGLSHARYCQKQGHFLATQLGMMELAVLDADDPESERRFATQLRRWLPDFGTTVMIVDHRPKAETMVSIRAVANRLAARDERILVVDCRADAADAVKEIRDAGRETVLEVAPSPEQKRTWTLPRFDSQAMIMQLIGAEVTATATPMDLNEAIEKARGDHSLLRADDSRRDAITTLEPQEVWEMIVISELKDRGLEGTTMTMDEAVEKARGDHSTNCTLPDKLPTRDTDVDIDIEAAADSWRDSFPLSGGGSFDRLALNKAGSADALASMAVQRIFENSRRQYSLIFVLCPAADQVAALELLDQYADGLCVFADPNQITGNDLNRSRNLNRLLESAKRTVVCRSAVAA